MNTPKRHHFVPQMVLDRFTDAEGKFHVFNKRASHQGVCHQRPDQHFYEGHLYSAIDRDGTKDPALEREFSRKEGVWNISINRIVTAATASPSESIGLSDIKCLGEFFYFQWTRTPDFINRLHSYGSSVELLNRAIADYEKNVRALSPAERTKISQPAAFKRIRQNALVKSLSTEQSAARDVLMSCRFTIAVLSDDQPEFIIGSQPVVFLIGEGQAILPNPQMELWLPIAPRVAVYPIQPNFIGASVTMMKSSRVHEINRSIFRQSTTVASANEAVIQHLASTYSPSTKA